MSAALIVMGPGDNRASCERCGEVMVIPLPMPMSAFGPWVRFAQAKHASCRAPAPPAQDVEPSMREAHRKILPCCSARAAGALCFCVQCLG